MEWDLDARRATLSARELAAFQSAPIPELRYRGLKERAELGQEWHSILQKNAEKKALPDERVRVEVPVEGMLQKGGWKLKIRGRIDLWTESETGLHLQEIKTIRHPLPADPDFLASAYTDYFLQLAVYWALHRQVEPDRPLNASLLFVDIAAGITQSVPLDATWLEDLQRPLEAIVSFLEDLRTMRKRLDQLHPGPPFPSWREGQEICAQGLQMAVEQQPTIFFEAPTGFGKTGLVLDVAFRALQRGEVDRILYLTGKNTGQIPVADQLSRLLGNPCPIRWLRFHSRESLRSQLGDFPENASPDAVHKIWQSSGLHLEDFFKDGSPDARSLGRWANRLGLDPYSLAKWLLPSCQLWVADYNYIFDPGVQQVFEGIPGYRQDKTFLIVDEIHNLPDRVADSWSFNWEKNTLEGLLTTLHFRHAGSDLIRTLDRLISTLKRLKKNEILEEDSIGELKHMSEDLGEIWKTRYGSIENSESADFQWFWNLSTALRTWKHPTMETVSWSPESGKLDVRCLDASAEIAPRIRSFRRTLLMSATIQPKDYLEAQLGFNPREVTLVTGEAPWKSDALQTAVDSRISTRYKDRPRSLNTTAKTLLLAASESDNLVVFFSSFHYARTVADRCRWMEPMARIRVQPRTMEFADQERFIEESLLLGEALFLVLGSRFSEGIDALGGKVDLAVVVGPALPEVNPVQETRKENWKGHRRDAFRAIYQIPAMRKINQALGRLVRAPGQKSRVLFHGERFSDPSYAQLIDPFAFPETQIETDYALRHWLQSSRTILKGRQDS